MTHLAPALAVGALAAVLAAGVAAGCGQASSPLNSRSPIPEPSPVARPSPSAGASPVTSPSPGPASPPTATSPAAPSPSPGQTGPGSSALPVLLGTIGDSMTRAANVGPGGLGDNPQHSWAVGTAPGDGVDSLLERFRALGADPLVADEAISGATMRMAPAMARRILTAAGGAPAPGPAAVTILMGANDACARTVNDMTSLESFERDLAGTLAILRDGATVEGGRTLPGLPTGSTLIVLAVPDVARLRDMAAPSGLAEAARGLFCPNLLAPDAPPDQVEAARARIQAFNAALAQACEEVEVRDGRTGRLHCRHDGGLLFTTLIGADDISSLDGFHPSLAGQAKLADLAWLTGPWSATRPIPGGATPAPGSGDSLPPPTRRASPRRSGAPAPGP